MNNYRLFMFKKKITQTALPFFVICCLSFSFLGCEAFVRKFTRKPKKTQVREEPVLLPEDYSLSDISTEERYRQYFLFWQSWQGELITALGSSASYRRIKTCLKESIRNLEEIESLLFQEKQKELDVYIERLRNLENEISQDIYGARSATYKSRVERLKRDILRDFSYHKVRNHLR